MKTFRVASTRPVLRCGGWVGVVRRDCITLERSDGAVRGAVHVPLSPAQYQRIVRAQDAGERVRITISIEKKSKES